jgi:integrin alpha FG-GAP repeat containing protein 1
LNDPSTWNKQLFLQPGWWIFWVGVALVTSFVGLAIVVLVLSLNEKVRLA